MISPPLPTATAEAPPLKAAPPLHGGVAVYLPWLVTLAACLLVSYVRAPVPAVNEPHYLGKAKHFWNPSWCAGDFFLDSANPHILFYVAFGWLTRWLTLAQTAVVGRSIGLALLAGGWHRLANSAGIRGWNATATAALFLALTAYGNFSGEWVVGGIEGKVVAYACLLWGAAAWHDGAPLPAALWTAIAIGFHPVVGVWSVAASLFAGLLGRLRERRQDGQVELRRLLPAGGVFVVIALLGLWPALQLVVGVAPEIAREADRITLTQRLGHHLDPLLFPASAYRYYAGLLAVACSLSLVTPLNSSLRGIRRYVVGALLIAAVGLAVGWAPRFTALETLDPRRITLLKFYPFRLADLALPWLVAVLAVQLGERCLSGFEQQWGSHGPSRVAAGLTTLLGLMTAVWLPAPDANASGMTPDVRQDWIAVCHWLRDSTPRESLVVMANENWAFKWFADRPEYVAFKDCPQDAAGIVEWWRRRQLLVAWSQAARRDGVITPAELLDLHALSGIDYLVVNAARFRGVSAELVHREGPFAVYALDPQVGRRRASHASTSTGPPLALICNSPGFPGY